MDRRGESDSYQAALDALMVYNSKNNIVQEYKDMVAVDVGAGEPHFYSNTYPLRELGFKVIAIEPIKRFCDMYTSLGYEVLNYAAYDKDLGEVLFREFPSAIGGLAGSGIQEISKVHGDQGCLDYLVPCLTLNTILKTHHPEITSIDILDIDTEGAEIEVLNGLNLDKYKPKVMIVENIDKDGNWTGTYGYHKFYESIGYEIIYLCAHNDILIRK